MRKRKKTAGKKKFRLRKKISREASSKNKDSKIRKIKAFLKKHRYKKKIGKKKKI